MRGGPRARSLVTLWVGGCTAWVFSLVVLGGITRLTRSGLSMTDWKFLGTLPPMVSEAEWGRGKGGGGRETVDPGLSLR